jgi:transposase-like protein
MSAQPTEELRVAAVELHGNGKATPAIMQAVIAGVEEGLSYAQAAVEAEVHPATVYSWRKKGQESEQEPYHTFVRECLRAEAKLALRCLKTVHEARQDPEMTPTQLKAATWMLERRFPDLWGQKMQVWSEEHVTVGGQVAGPGVDVQSWSTPDRIRAVHDIYVELGLDKLYGSDEAAAIEPPPPPEPPPRPATELVVQQYFDPDRCQHIGLETNKWVCKLCGASRGRGDPPFWTQPPPGEDD